ncbi:hypothetical protein ULMS_20510 [Patiriisocius marinistellae]|uniref:Dihydrolipoamide dehydrogenase n=1 Tax=Patiriisocius marinistellae TaxID=2494560 RepID=A0A5J4FWY7_9FLAO|nr:collagen-like protein [Patiriisocius marinistellae]GEQ86543.1 hypothetical protein ULMS_20510 [Patiriisocius marinistellae]
MKHLFLFIGITTALIFSSCEGDQGPPGEPGINILGQVFETTTNFNNGNAYESLVSFPSNITVFESDAILVYWLEDVVSDGNGGSIDVWSPLPQTLYVDGGSFQYTFNHTFLDVLIFLQGDIDLNTLGSGFTNNQTFRIAVVPSEFADANLSMDDLLRQIEVDTSEIERISN